MSSHRIKTVSYTHLNIWVAPYHQGVKCYDRNGKLLHSYDTTNSRLQTNVILSLAERDGQIWVGTDGSGIYILNPKDDTMSVLVVQNIDTGPIRTQDVYKRQGLRR